MLVIDSLKNTLGKNLIKHNFENSWWIYFWGKIWSDIVVTYEKHQGKRWNSGKYEHHITPLYSSATIPSPHITPIHSFILVLPEWKPWMVANIEFKYVIFFILGAICLKVGRHRKPPPLQLISDGSFLQWYWNSSLSFLFRFVTS
jgi:hypothetical protein